jgi:hypothetical protein
MQLALLDFVEANYSTSYLQNPVAETHLDSKTIQALLKLDPFVAGGPSADLSQSPRFAYIDTYNVQGPRTQVTTYSLTTADMQQTVVSTLDVETDNAGFLGFVGIGVPQTQTIQSTVSQSSAVQTLATSAITTEVDFYAAPDEPPYEVDVYCDVVFGTFAFRKSGLELPKPGKQTPLAEVALEPSRLKILEADVHKIGTPGFKNLKIKQ